MPDTSASVPLKFGRYLVHRPLGSGGFGTVYLGYDDELDRPVAIKVPRAGRTDSPHRAESFLKEARHVAQLDHPNIVPVYDVGHAAGQCYVVYKFIKGCSLAERLRHSALQQAEAAQLVAVVADALDYAHRHGVYHRDVKPGNILLDTSDVPYLADFGVAVREEELAGQRGCAAGTYQYMSPEQLRGEGHRIDGRTDIYSLGVVLYQLLCGRRPFDGPSKDELIDQILYNEAKPPRQFDGSISRELERICLKALAKRVTDRYTIAADLAEELHLAAQSLPALSGSAGSSLREDVAPTAAEASSSTKPMSTDSAVPVVPKGLLSFGPEDSDFYLQLLPGPCDREGLPESIRFWKSPIEHREADQAFAVGLLYGPSGCGKTSLVRAGLLPRLAGSVVPIYVEATREETEARLAKALRKVCFEDLPDAGLAGMIASLRRGQSGPAQKVLIVLDQFEQWLHAHPAPETSELVSAIRQCDGAHVQCLLMVRDDFWLAVSRFVRALEIRLIEGRNVALADLFEPPHARKVLAMFGRSYGALPPGELNSDQQKFLDQAVQDLAEEGKVIPVRLSLFAEMLKGKPWALSTLKRVGGMRGLGLAFLEESFSSRAANPEHRRHERGVRAILKALLPEQGTEIRGHMRTYQQLLAASGCRESDFNEILRMLDTEVRLVTPTDPEGSPDAAAGQTHAAPADRYYQLTHDYLVPVIREWLSAKQRQTMRGRAELQLAESAAFWSARPLPRHLPGLWSYAKLVLLTRTSSRSERERQLLRAATRRHAIRTGALFAMLIAAAFMGKSLWAPIHVNGLRDRLMDAEISQVPSIVAEMRNYRRWLNPKLNEIIRNTQPADREHLYASLAMLPVDPGRVPYLKQRMLQAPPKEFLVIREALLQHGDRTQITADLWRLAEDGSLDSNQAFRAACALAQFDPENSRWPDIANQVVSQLVKERELLALGWAQALSPVRGRLVNPLKAAFLDATKPAEIGSARHAAAIVLAVYLADELDALIELTGAADPLQLPVIVERLPAHGATARQRLRKKLDEPMPRSADPEAMEQFAKAQANVAIALLQSGDDAGWTILRQGVADGDPRARSYFIHRVVDAAVNPYIFVRRLDAEQDEVSLRPLVLAIGECYDSLRPNERELLINRFARVYQQHDDAGVHGAAEWVLRSWKQTSLLQEIDAALVKQPNSQGNRKWYVNSEGHTMVIVPPGQFLMGCEGEGVQFEDGAKRHVEQIEHTFAIAAKEVTVRQFLAFSPDYPYDKVLSPDLNCPINSVSLADVEEYCHWLSDREEITDERFRYRAPVEAEWERACRSGSTTTRYYGQTDELLAKYAWCDTGKPSPTQAVGLLKPNDFGLFDSYGNLMEWCQEPSSRVTDRERKNRSRTIPGIYRDEHLRCLRGNWVGAPAAAVHSCYRFPTNTGRFPNAGFRIARTLPPLNPSDEP